MMDYYAHFDTIQERLEKKKLDSSIIMSIIQFYDNNNNFQFDCWIELKFYTKIKQYSGQLWIKFSASSNEMIQSKKKVE